MHGVKHIAKVLTQARHSYLALTNGLLEVGTEYISGGIKLPGTGKITSEIIDKATKTIKRVTKFVVKYLANVGWRSSGRRNE